uniref:Uncharacterized protein n=1 Tax=Arundo donax TaxID=35708 RepID=A0A0A9CM66_ARUDO
MYLVTPTLFTFPLFFVLMSCLCPLQSRMQMQCRETKHMYLS